jgi:hypothetical protein
MPLMVIGRSTQLAAFEWSTAWMTISLDVIELEVGDS